MSLPSYRYRFAHACNSPSCIQLALALVACAAVSGCGSFDSMSQRMVGSITPYKVEIVQGNFVSREQVAALKPGMSRQQVRDILGTPLVARSFTLTAGTMCSP